MNQQPPPPFIQNSDNEHCFSVSPIQPLSSPLSTHEKVINLIQLSKALNTKNHYSHPCLLLSKSEQNRSELNELELSNKTSFNQHVSVKDQCFSFLMLNPLHKKHLSNKQEMELWQHQITAELHKTASKLYANNIQNTLHIPFHSGWVGYYPYSSTKADNRPQILAEFYYYPWSICLDHNSGLFHLLGSPDSFAVEAFETLKLVLQESLKENLKEIKKPVSLPICELESVSSLSTKFFNASPFKPAWSKSDYERAFYKIRDYLKAGDCYQVNLTQPHHAKYTGPALSTVAPLYSALNPSYGCYFEGRDRELVSVSPERFMSIDAKGRIEAKPIKGTIKRSSNEQQDQRYINELIHSSKNQAENLMIVDLLRNDLSMSAKPNSVKVEKLFELETHPNVHHLVSTISGQLRAGLSPTCAITKAFPGGSITGAPKKRAMEIIEELEAQPRSLYCGSFGYYSDSGHADFNILIRSVEFRNNTMTCWGGGGITVDSDCDEEYEESLTKVRKIMKVIEAI
jgi:para-aminobenzoate synthetase component 1